MKIHSRHLMMGALLFLCVLALHSPTTAWAGYAYQTIPTARPTKAATTVAPPPEATAVRPTSKPEKTATPQRPTSIPTRTAYPQATDIIHTTVPTDPVSEPVVINTPLPTLPQAVTPVGEPEIINTDPTPDSGLLGEPVETAAQQMTPEDVVEEKEAQSDTPSSTTGKTGATQCMMGSLLIIAMLLLIRLVIRL